MPPYTRRIRVAYNGRRRITYQGSSGGSLIHSKEVLRPQFNVEVSQCPTNYTNLWQILYVFKAGPGPKIQTGPDLHSLAKKIY